MVSNKPNGGALSLSIRMYSKTTALCIICFTKNITNLAMYVHIWYVYIAYIMHFYIGIGSILVCAHKVIHFARP